MIKKFYPVLRYINSYPLERKIVDCGAGGRDPKLAFFFENGFEVYGIDVSDDQINESMKYCIKNNIKLNIIEGDMRNIPFDSNFFSFVYSR